jgi:hypothetical protein
MRTKTCALATRRVRHAAGPPIDAQSAARAVLGLQALGSMAVAVALAGVDVALVGHLGILWWLPLPALAVSLAVSVAALSQPEIETGQNLSLAIAMDGAGETRRRLLLRSVADALDSNTKLLAGRRALVAWALALIGLAFVLLGIAQLAPVLQDLAARTAT